MNPEAEGSQTNTQENDGRQRASEKPEDANERQSNDREHGSDKKTKNDQRRIVMGVHG